jgi:branched-chain amino acid transport system permease protein
MSAQETRAEDTRARARAGLSGINTGLSGSWQRLPSWGKLLVYAALIGLALILPADAIGQVMAPRSDWASILFYPIGIYILLAIGLNIVVGQAGLLDLGYVAFFAIGGYGMAVMGTKFGWSFWEIFPTAILLSALAGVILGAPTLRLRGDYLAIVTLGFGEIIRITANNTAYVGGPRGISNIPHPPSLSAQQVMLVGALAILVILVLVALATVPSLLDRRRVGEAVAGKARNRLVLLAVGILLALAAIVVAIASPGTARVLVPSMRFGIIDPKPYYYLVVALCVLIIVLAKRLERSRVGRAWVAIREDEDAAELMGVPTFRFKLWSFAIGASIGGAAGVVFASKVIAIVPDNFPFILSVLILAAVVLGGSGNLPGVILGGFLVAWLPERFRGFENYRVLVFGAALVLMMIFRPEGLLPSGRRRAEFAEGSGGMGSLGAEVAGTESAPTTVEVGR